jgi:multidrug resistance efflux pump
VSLLGVVPASGSTTHTRDRQSGGVRSLRRPRGGPRNIAGQRNRGIDRDGFRNRDRRPFRRRSARGSRQHSGRDDQRRGACPIEEELSTVAEAKKQYDRLQPLVQRGAASTSLLDQRRREYETAKARLRAIESKLQDRLIIAPFAGIVGFAQHQRGRTHRAGGPHHHPGRRQRHEA